MEWRDEGIVIGVRRHGETSAIVEAMTRAHGRHLGLVRGGRRASAARAAARQYARPRLARAARRASRRLRGRAADAAGRAADLPSALALAGVGYLGALLRLLPERDPHEAPVRGADLIADHLDDADLAPALVARFEAQVLAECGFALDLERCAATGAREDLIYVSPESRPRRQRRRRRAVARAAAAVAGLPAPGAAAPAPERGRIADAFRLTGFFLARDLFAPRGLALPDARRAFLAAAAKAEG